MPAAVTADALFDAAVAYGGGVGEAGAKFPTGSWRNWLRGCYEIIETRHRFRCSWPLFLGMTIGLLRMQNAAGLREFCKVMQQDYQRPNEYRFRIMFVALAHFLSATSTVDTTLRQLYRGIDCTKLRRIIPGHVLCWPTTKTETGTRQIFQAMCPINVAMPAFSTQNYIDFFPQLVYGYFAVIFLHPPLPQEPDDCAALLHEELERQRKENEQPPSFIFTECIEKGTRRFEIALREKLFSVQASQSNHGLVPG